MTNESVAPDFAATLLEWFDLHRRVLPWRGSKDPYTIWITEIIFQQTRIEQGMDYYHRFIQAFPDVFSLAAADDDQVMKLWEGLGYYNRARNLLTAARYIVLENAGRFPHSRDSWLELKGVGAYTAALVASVCFDEAVAALDGNVLRVLSRYFDDPTPADTAAGKKHFTARAQTLIDHQRPGDFNEALMDLGAKVCTPRNPKCTGCPLADSCAARRENRQTELPLKAPKKKSRIRHLHYFCISSSDRWFIRRRDAGDIWPGLYEYVLMEGEATEQELKSQLEQLTRIPVDHLPAPVLRLTHQLTHQKLHIQVFMTELPAVDEIAGYEKRSREEITQLSFPRPLRDILALGGSL